jgi:Uma2 family endonuclease
MATPARTELAAPRRYTVEEYFALVDQGVLSPDDRVELLEGVVVAMPPSNPPHAAAVTRLTRALSRAVGDRATLRCQLPLIVGRHGAPDPDVAVVEPRDDDYLAEHPASAFLVAEVADSSLKQDRLTKGPLYAAAGIPEYWIVNLPDDCVEVHRQPDRAAATYTAVSVARRGERIEPVALPGATVAVEDLLPPVPKRPDG